MRTRDHALALAAMGLPVLPCGLDKISRVKDWGNTATTDPKQIKLWWSQPWTDKGQLIGVLTGPASGFSVVDIDPRHDGDLWFYKHFDKLRHTRRHATKSGGYHLLFRHKEGVRNKQQTKFADGVDFRGEGGYIIWWPANGYEVPVDLPLNELPDWPDWISELAGLATLAGPARLKTRPISKISNISSHAIAGAHSKRYRDYAVQALRHAIQVTAVAKEGVRNVTLNAEFFKLTWYIRDGALSQNEVAEAMVAAGRACQLDDDAIVNTIESVMKSLDKGVK